MKASFVIGAARTDITPPLRIPYLGVRPRHCFFRGIHDRLYGRALYVTDESTECFVLATDTLGFGEDLLPGKRSFVQALRADIAAATGVRARNIMVTSSHIHSTPETIGIRPLRIHPGVDAWLESLKAGLVSAAVSARRNAVKASLRVGAGRAAGLARNRRNDEFLDEEVLVLLFESRKGAQALVVNAVCHPVILQVQPWISADYVGVVQTRLERLFGGAQACLFLQGACGDIDPIKGCTRSFNDVQMTGLTIVGEVLKLCGHMKLHSLRTEPVILRTASRRVMLPSRPLPSGAERKEIRRKAAAGAHRAAEALRRLELGAGPFAAEVQVLRLGNCVLVGIPGEPFCQMGLEIKRKARPLRALPVGYANGYVGYIAPRTAWTKGGYEVQCGPWSKVGPAGYDIIQSAVERLLGEVRYT